MSVPPVAHILVVDDDPDLRETIQWCLEDEGLTVETAADGPQAIERATQSRPALILLDMGLPILSGEEAADQIRAAYGGDPPPLSSSPPPAAPPKKPNAAAP